VHERSTARTWIAAGLVFGALAIAVPAQRLAPAVTPEHYTIHLAPDFATDTFAGRVSISVRLSEPSRSITLHAAEIEFHDTTITAAGSKQDAMVSLDLERETATLTVPREMPAGAATIDIRYTGLLNDKLRGFYLSRANNREYAITQLEPTDARRAFPSFDEPAFKATFALSATIDSADTAISNGRLLSDTPGPGEGRHTLTFATTKRMSTYLVALLVGDWQCIGTVADRIPVRVCGTPDRKDELAFALESSAFALKYFNRYFSIDYPFEKLDIIAVPDFSAGAMENTGAIVFREQFLLVGKDGGTTDLRKQVAQYIAHEIAHQWFGDLVTMQWWDDIWLNEGFATWMERRPIDEWKPDWDAKLDEVRDTQRAMNLDTLRATRPIRTRVETPDEIGQVFDAIAYQKTAAVIRMIEGFVGPAAYRDAINAYVKKFAYRNAAGEGFWETLASVTKKPVDRILSGYITQGGIPLVDVETRCAGGATELALSQRPISPDVPAATTWQIPVCYKRSRNGVVEPEKCAVLSEQKAAVRLAGCSAWVFANVEGRGYYRTSYGSDGLRALGEAVRRNHLTQVEQTVLVEDVWALVRLGDENIADYLSLANGFLAGQPTPVLQSVLNRIDYIATQLTDDALRPRFERWVQEKLRPLAQQMGWTPKPGESEATRSIRAAVLFTLGHTGRDPGVLQEARRLVDAHFDETALDPSIAETALELAAINGDRTLYERYFSRMTGSTRRDDEVVYRRALTHFTDAALTKRTLEYATSSDVRSQDAPNILRQLMAQPAATAPTWAHIKNNWASLEKSLDVFQGLPAIVGSTQHFCDVASREDVERFFSAHQVRGTERTLEQALETIDRCIATKNRQSKNLADFLN
jgi:aminopeptidase N